jgi:hypothetical protein
MNKQVIDISKHYPFHDLNLHVLFDGTTFVYVFYYNNINNHYEKLCLSKSHYPATKT